MESTQSNINVTVRMDRELKREAEALFKSLGMTLTTAFNVFARQAVRTQSIPFRIDATVVGVDKRAVDFAVAYMDEYPDDFQRLAL